jgi:O-antigen/teichoic acid export membrane protein
MMVNFHQKILSKIKKENGIYLIANITSTAFSFISITLIAKFIGLNIVGQITSAIAISSILVAFIQSASNSYIVQNYFKSDSKDGVALSTFPIFIFNSILLLIFLYISTFFYHFNNMYLIFVIAIIKSFYSTPLLILRFNRVPIKYLLSYTSGSIFKLLGISSIIFLYPKQGISSYLIVYISADLIILLLSSMLSLKYLSLKNFSIKHSLRNLKHSYNFLPHKIAKSIIDNIDILAIDYFLTDQNLGLYSIVKKGLTPGHIITRSLLTKLNIDIAEFILIKPIKLLRNIKVTYSRVWLIYILFIFIGVIYAYNVTNSLITVILLACIITSIFMTDFSNLLYFSINFQNNVKRLNLLSTFTFLVVIGSFAILEKFNTINIYTILSSILGAKLSTNLIHFKLNKLNANYNSYGLYNLFLILSLLAVSLSISKL